MAPERIRQPLPLGLRGAVLISIAMAGWWSWYTLGIGLDDLVPHGGGSRFAGDFFARALSPAFKAEADFIPPGAPPLLMNAFEAAGRTLVYAAAAMSLAVIMGIVLGFLASSAWWAEDPAGGRRWGATLFRRAVAPSIYFTTRVMIAVMRSIHEVLWAILFMTAMGRSELAAVLSIAIPYGGTLAKIFSEMVDESPRDAAQALRGAGASGTQVFVFGLVTRAFPDMIAYAFYRFECALRSAAILGFFGWETLGLYIRQSFKSLEFGEVWTYLYTLFGMVIFFDWWSGQLRRRLVS